nr:MAG TPA: hypothetical protein [Caudoviricetes sp.]
MFYIVIHSHIHRFAIEMSKSKQLPVFHRSILNRRSTGPHNKNVKLLDAIKILRRYDPHILTNLQTDALHISKRQHSMLLFCLTHSLAFHLHEVSLISLPEDAFILPQSSLRKKIQKTTLAISHFHYSEPFFYDKNVILTSPGDNAVLFKKIKRFDYSHNIFQILQSRRVSLVAFKFENIPHII